MTKQQKYEELTSAEMYYKQAGFPEFKRLEPNSDIIVEFADEPKEPLISKVNSTETISASITMTKEQYSEVMKRFANIAIQAASALKKTFKTTVDYAYSLYPNKRVKHLAKHSKKARVRKKNRKRIIKELTQQSERAK